MKALAPGHIATSKREDWVGRRSRCEGVLTDLAEDFLEACHFLGLQDVGLAQIVKIGLDLSRGELLTSPAACRLAVGEVRAAVGVDCMDLQYS